MFKHLVWFFTEEYADDYILKMNMSMTAQIRYFIVLMKFLQDKVCL